MGGTVTYTVTLTNTGPGAQGDNPGNEFTDVLPAHLALVSATATSGTAVANVGTNTVTWNGSIPAGGSRDDHHHGHDPAGRRRHHRLEPGHHRLRRRRQRDERVDGGRPTIPGTPGSGDPTSFAVGAAAIPTLSPLGMLALALILAALALVSLKARRPA